MSALINQAKRENAPENVATPNDLPRLDGFSPNVAGQTATTANPVNRSQEITTSGSSIPESLDTPQQVIPTSPARDEFFLLQTVASGPVAGNNGARPETGVIHSSSTSPSLTSTREKEKEKKAGCLSCRCIIC
jgi:hypothetical protein